MKKILLIVFALFIGFVQAQVKKKAQTKLKIEKKWVNPVKLTKEERSRPYMDEVLKTKDSLTPQEAERRRKNIAIGNPFAKYGYYPKIATLSRGKYLEFHDTDSIVVIGSIKYNTKSGNVVEIREVDLSDPDAQPIGDTHGRWMSPDPLSEEFSSWSPYNFVFNNPLKFTDPTGMAPEDIYKLNQNGSLTWMSASGTDKIYAENNFDNKGNLKETNDGGVEVGEKGYIAANSQTITLDNPVTDNSGNSSNTLSTLSFYNNEAKAQETAEYIYNNTNVETANSTYKSFTTGNSFSVLSTFHLPSASPLDPKLSMKNFSVDGDSFFPSTLSSQDHNHPLSTTIAPSGLDYSSKNGFTPTRNIFAFVPGAKLDTNVARANSNLRLRVYSSPLKKYINYNEKSASFAK